MSGDRIRPAFHSCFIQDTQDQAQDSPRYADDRDKNPLMRHWFDVWLAQGREPLCDATKVAPCLPGRTKILLAKFLIRIYSYGRAEFVRFHLKESQNGLESTEDR